MKVVWLLLALVLTALTGGGVMSVVAHGDPIELALTVVFGFGAVGCWRRATEGRRVQRGEQQRPWER